LQASLKVYEKRKIDILIGRAKSFEDYTKFALSKENMIWLCFTYIKLFNNTMLHEYRGLRLKLYNTHSNITTVRKNNEWLQFHKNNYSK